MFKKLLIRMARAILQRVLQGLMQQFNVVEEMAMNPMRQMIEAVVGGVWVGKGADAFVEEVSSLMIPGVTQVQEHIDYCHTNLNRAQEIMDQADAQVRTRAGALGDMFAGIY